MVFLVTQYSIVADAGTGKRAAKEGDASRSLYVAGPIYRAFGQNRAAAFMCLTSLNDVLREI